MRRSLGPAHEHLLPEALKSWRAEYARRLLVKTRPYPGIPELLRVPPQTRGVLTNKPGGFSREILQGLGMLGSFQAVIGGDEAPRKPEPEGLLALCRALGSDPAGTGSSRSPTTSPAKPSARNTCFGPGSVILAGESLSTGRSP